MLLVRIGEIEFHGHTDRGFLIGPGGFKGWEGAPASRRESGDRPGAHGSFRTPAFKGARLVTLAGTALASSEAEVVYMGDVLAGVGQSTVRVSVTTEAGTLWADGDVEGPIIWDRVGGTAEADYELSLLFPDPFKYGGVHTSVSTGGNVSTSHRGNTDAWQRFTVTGNMPNGYWLSGRGRVFEVPGPLAPGQTDVVDFKKRTVRRNGALVTGIGAAAWSVPGGAVVDWSLTPFGGVGSGTATSALLDTYI